VRRGLEGGGVNAARASRPALPAQTELERPEGVAAARLLIGRSAAAWTLPEQIAAEIGERILDEVIRPAERIGEDKLAREFRVSRGPIRDALKILENVGLVTITSRKGAAASALSSDDFLEIASVRSGLFGIALRGFGRMATAKTQELYKAHLDTITSVTNEDRLALVWLEAVDRLMLFIAHHCGNRRAANLLTTLSLQSVRYFRRSSVPAMNPAPRRREVLKFYRDLGAAYEKGGDIEPFLERLQRIVEERTNTTTATFR
jgi:DNA-binding GntR family transcriptional regulator